MPTPDGVSPRTTPTSPARSRRWALGAIGAGVVLATQAVGWLRQRGSRAQQGTPPQNLFLETTAALCGACFGHHLSAAEVGSLVRTLQSVRAIDPKLYAILPTVAAFADREARSRHAPSYLSADPTVQLAVIDHLMAPVDTRRSALLARFWAHERDRRMIRWEAMDRLPAIYAGAAPAWQRRGYTRRPGLGGGSRDYTRPMSSYPC